MTTRDKIYIVKCDSLKEAIECWKDFSIKYSRLVLSTSWVGLSIKTINGSTYYFKSNSRSNNNENTIRYTDDEIMKSFVRDF